MRSVWGTRLAIVAIGLLLIVWIPVGFLVGYAEQVKERYARHKRSNQRTPESSRK